MNAATANASSDSAPERSSVVLAVAAALVALAAAVVWMVRQRADSLDAAAVFAERFEAGALPFGLEVTQAERLARGDVVLHLARPDAPAEAERAKATSGDAASKPAGEGERPRFDWSKVDYGQPGAPPREVVIADLPLVHASADLDALFKGGFELRGDYDSLDEGGGKRVLRRGMMRWGEFDCGYVHEREFERGGTFRDVVRVNLSRARTPRVLIARFGRNVAGSIEPIETLLAALHSR